MGLRVVHIINGDCEIFLHKSQKDFVTIRVTEQLPDSCPSESADFEFEGDITALRSLFSTLNTVMSHVETMSEEIN